MHHRIGATTRRLFPAGITLIELLICIAIIAMLVSLLFAVASRARESVRRATDLSNLHQLTVACISYAQQNDGVFPPGRVSAAAPGNDDYSWLNYTRCWRPLLAISPSLATINSCVSVKTGYGEASDFGQPGGSYGHAGDTQVGWVYWAGRDDLWSGTTLKYRSLRRLSDHLTPGSQTLWTCLCWDSNSGGGASVCPHVGTSYVEYPNGVTLTPPPDGLGVALTDGSASFISWSELIIVEQANWYKLYYQP